MYPPPPPLLVFQPPGAPIWGLALNPTLEDLRGPSENERVWFIGGGISEDRELGTP